MGVDTIPIPQNSSLVGARIYLNANQAIAHDTWTKALLNAVTFDTLGAADLANNRLIVKKTGLYLALCCIGYANIEVVALSRVSVGIKRNADFILINHNHTSIVDYYYLQALCGAELTLNDTVELWVCHNFGATKNLRGVEATTWLALME